MWRPITRSGIVDIGMMGIRDCIILQSRYYDPMTCRFVNADRYASTGQGLAGCNMFAYCNNNPVCYDDPTGTRANGPTFTFVNDGGGGSPDPHDKTAGMVNGQGSTTIF
ncbi:MAG: RHS repeat-associated core domain-containing protein [Oscillospiraceae bacterium]